MRCDRAQPVLSARMDGESVRRAWITAAEAHAATCASCALFLERSMRVRTAVRIRPAEPVPDLIEPIMAAVAVEAGRRPAPLSSWRGRLDRRGRPAPSQSGRRRALAAAVVGVLVGSLAVGGPWRTAKDQPLAIATVARNVRAAARSLDAYSATFAVIERGLSREVPERRFEVDVAFSEPQRFFMKVRDLTPYPSERWTPTHLRYVENMSAAYRYGPHPCPPAVGTCSTWRPEYVQEWAASPQPIDLIVPIATFRSTEGIRLVGSDVIDGREAVHVALPYDRAEALFPFTRVGGTWRPFFGGDRVDLWLDAETWFPLRSTVTPSESPDRDGWEMRFARWPERPDEPILEVDAITVSAARPDPSLFDIPGVGERTRMAGSLRHRLGFTPVTPAETAGLELVSAWTPNGGPNAPRSILLYARGLDYLRIEEHPGWRDHRSPLAAIGSDAEEVVVGPGVGRFEAATDGEGNRLAIRAANTEVYLESNLPREELLAIAASMPIVGLPFGDETP